MHHDDNLILSATAVVLRDGKSGLEVLLLQRNKAIKVHGGSWVFPGGKTDITDIPSHFEASELDQLKGEEKHYVKRVTACREAKEEAGINLTAEELIPYSRWITPETMKKRFDTLFFLTTVENTKVEIDNSEIQDFVWLSPSQALAKHTSGELALPPPTYLTLLNLAEYTNCEEAIKNMGGHLNEYRPKLLLTETGFHSLYQQDSFYKEPCTQLKAPSHRLIFSGGSYQYIDTTRHT